MSYNELASFCQQLLKKYDLLKKDNKKLKNKFDSILKEKDSFQNKLENTSKEISMIISFTLVFMFLLHVYVTFVQN